MQDKNSFQNYIKNLISSINELDFITYYNIHKSQNSKSNWEYNIVGYKGKKKFKYTIPLTKYKGVKDKFNIKCYPLFKQSNDGDYNEIVTNEKYTQKNITFKKYQQLNKKSRANNGLPFKTAFFNTKSSQLIFQTNILNKEFDIENISIKNLNIGMFDIETSAGYLEETGENVGSPFFNKPKNKNKIRTVVFYNTKKDKFYIFSYKNFNLNKIKNMISENVYYESYVDTKIKNRFDNIKEKIVRVDCSNEEDLLKKLVEHFRNYEIIVGWNSDNFDLPFIISRVNNVLGRDYVNKLSPFGNVNYRIIESEKDGSLIYKNIDISGISHIDLMIMYKNFSFGTRMKYSLDYISEFETGISKIDFDGDNYDDFYKNDFDNYILYNIQDVNLLNEISIKTNYIYLALIQASESKVNITDTYSKTTLHTFAIIDKMRKKKLVYANDKEFENFRIDGSYVEANKGVFRLVKSRDFTSLYPTNLIECNMSVETIFFKKDYDKMVKEIGEENIIKTLNDDVFFRKDKIGIIAEYVYDNFMLRKKYKKLMKKYKGVDEQKYKMYDDFQYNQKIKINSVYGFLACDFGYFSYYYIADLITKFGRYLIKKMKSDLEKINKDEELLSSTYNQNIYELYFNDKTYKVYDDTNVLIKNENNENIKTKVKNLSSNDILVKILK